jgi:hypothetical protein
MNRKLFVGYLTQVKYEGELNRVSSHAQALTIYGSSGFSENFTATHRYPFLIEEDGDKKTVRFLLPREMYSMMGFPRGFKLSKKCRGTQLRQLSNSINLFMLRPVCEHIIASNLQRFSKFSDATPN